MNEIDFTCYICGAECIVAPDPPTRAVCPEHCPDHLYEYIPGERRRMCENCGQEPPLDYYVED